MTTELASTSPISAVVFAAQIAMNTFKLKKTVAIHVSIDPLNEYRGCHEAACVPGIPGSRHFVFARRPVGIHYVRLVGDTLLSG